MAEDLYDLIKRRQDELRGGPKPPPTLRERIAPAVDWIADNGASICFVLAGIAAMVSAALRFWIYFCC